MEDMISQVAEAEDGDHIFERIKEDLKSARNPGNVLITRHPMMKRSISDLDRETRKQLAGLSDEIGASIYVAQPLIQDPEEGVITGEMIEEYVNLIKEMSDENEHLTIVPVLHLSDAEPQEAIQYALKVEEELPDEEFPFIGITGNSPFSNKPAFLGVRENSDKKLFVDNCPKKIGGNARDELGKISRQQFYMSRGAKIVLDKKYFIGGSSPGIEVMRSSEPEYEDTTIDDAESSIPDLEFNKFRDELKGSSSLPHFVGLHNELAEMRHVQQIREDLKEGEVLDSREKLVEAVDHF